MTDNEIQSLIQEQLSDADVHVEGDGYHFVARVVSPAFDSLSTVKRQQAVYACVSDKIASGEIHALTVKAFSPDEWQQNKDK